MVRFLDLYFAVTLSKRFFPKQDPTVALLLTLGTFGTAYLVLTAVMSLIVLVLVRRRVGLR
jgi:hypothetical protein